jgi:hypothetical protein
MRGIARAVCPCSTSQGCHRLPKAVPVRRALKNTARVNADCRKSVSPRHPSCVIQSRRRPCGSDSKLIGFALSDCRKLSRSISSGTMNAFVAVTRSRTLATRPAIGVEAVQDEDWRAGCRLWFGHDSLLESQRAPQRPRSTIVYCRRNLPKIAGN